MQNVELKDEYITLGNKAITFDTILEEAEDIQKYCSDYVVSEVPKNVIFDANSLNLKYLAGQFKVNNSSLTPYALSQLCVKLGVPYRYIAKCIDEGQTDLVAENLNCWLSDYKGSLMIREYKNNIRGVLSNRYCAFDTPKILEAFSAVSKNVGEFDVKGYFLSPERFHLRLTEVTPLDVLGETLFCGFTIDSSDVGRKTLTISFFVYRQVCTNGLCIAQFNDVLYSQKHMRIEFSEFSSGVMNSFAKFPELKSMAHHMIVNSMSKSAPLKVEQSSILNPTEDMLSKVQNIADVSADTAKKVFNTWGNVYDSQNSMWAFTNALTEVARDMALENRLTLEKKAGDLLAVA